MWREIEPDEIRRVEVEGGSVVTYSFGSGEETVLLLNGGPGLPCDYLRDSHLDPGRMARDAQAHRAGHHHAALPAAARPELNPQENIWQFMRDNWLSNRIFADYDDIAARCCPAWNKLIEQPRIIMSIGLRDRANAFPSAHVGISASFAPRPRRWTFTIVASAIA